MFAINTIAAAVLMCMASYPAIDNVCYEDYAVPGKYEITAYTNSENETAPFHDGITGALFPADPELRIIAVDPKEIPLFSKVWIEDLGWFIAGDTGGDIKGERIDVLLHTKKAAFEYGRKKDVLALVIPSTGVCSRQILRNVWQECSYDGDEASF